MQTKICKDEEIVLCTKAIENFGPATQQVVAMEECGELIQAISKSIRGAEHNVEEEIADVEIMIEQLKLMFDRKKVEAIKQQKLYRLKGMVL